MDILILKPLVVRKLCQFSGMSNAAFMHREDLKGSKKITMKYQIIHLIEPIIGCYIIISKQILASL